MDAINKKSIELKSDPIWVKRMAQNAHLKKIVAKEVIRADNVIFSVVDLFFVISMHKINQGCR